MGERRSTEGPPTGSRAGGTETQEHEGGRLDPDSVYAVLDHPRRRLVVDVLIDLDSVTMRDLATQIAAREAGVPPHAISDAQRESVTIALYHVHVPKLVDSGVVTVDGGMERLSPGPHTQQVYAAKQRLDDALESTAD